LGCARIIGRAEQNPICLGVPHPVQPFQVEGDGGQRELDRYFSQSTPLDLPRSAATVLSIWVNAPRSVGNFKPLHLVV
jgi:hypothetical protein